jgi:hypothetical protein
MATLGAFDPELRREALFDPTLVAEGWFDPELIDAAGAAGLTLNPTGVPSSERAGAASLTPGAVSITPTGVPSTFSPGAAAIAYPPTDVAVTILDYATLGPINGASGGSMSGHLLYAVNTGRWWFFTYGTVLASGTATGGTNQTLVDSGAAFTTALNGRTVVIIAGTGAGNAFEVTRSSATTLRLQNNGDPATPATLTFTPDATSQYRVVDSRKIRAYVSSSSDLSSATWAAATGSASADMTNGVGVDMAGGRFDGGAFGGTYPTDGRQLAVTYADVAGHDIAYAIAQVGVHWFKISNRARLTAATTIAWDNTSSNTNPWDDGYGAQEALPYAYQPLVLAFDTNNSRWHVIWNKTQGMAGSAWTSNENGTLTQSPTWGGYIQTDTYDASTDNNSTHYPYQAALAELASGIMLAVYCFGNAPSLPFSTTNATQTGLRFTKSSSATAWPTTNTIGAAVPSLSSTANSPNDWAMVQRTTTDVHVVRRNSATVLEHIRYDGTTWGSVTTLPTSGLTGHVSNSGIGLATDGTTVWCVALDSDANNSIKYLTWTAGGGWASSWTTLSTNGNVKAFVTVHQRVGNNQIGVAWTEGPDGSGRYSVRGAAISATAGSTQSITPAGVPSEASVGAATVVPSAVSLTPAGVPSSELAGASVVSSSASILPAGAPSQEAAGAPAVTSSAALAPTGFPSGERAGASSVTPGVVSITPTGAPSAELSGAASVVPTTSIVPAGVPSQEASGASAVSGTVTITPAGVRSEERAGASALSASATLAAGPVATSEAVGATAVSSLATLTPAATGSNEQPGASALAPGTVSIAPAGVPSGELAGPAALVTAPTQAITPTGVPSAAPAGASAVTSSAALAPTGVPSSEAVGQASFISGAVIISPTGVPTGEMAGAAALVSAATQSITPTGVPSQAPAGASSVTSTAQIQPAGVPSSESTGRSQVIPGAVAITPTGAPSGEQSAASIIASTAPLIPAPVASESRVAPSQITALTSILAAGVPSGERAGGAAMLPGGVALVPGPVSSSEMSGAASLLLIDTIAITISISDRAAGGASLSDRPAGGTTIGDRRAGGVAISDREG